MKHRTKATLAFLACFALSAAAQEKGAPIRQSKVPPAEGAIFRIDSQLVQIYLTVTEGARRITDLEAPAFSLAEDGVRQEIDRVDAAEVPLTIALLLDSSESMREAMPSTQDAAVCFVESLSPADRVSLISFNHDIRSFLQATDDKRPVIDAIRSAEARGGTKLYDALLVAMKHLSGKEGRKAIVVFSDGADTARQSSLDVVLNAAARYGFPIYTIGAGSGVRQESLKKVLRQIAEINSGKPYLVEDPRMLRGAFAQVASELRSAYVINYYTRVPHDGRWHDVRVTLDNPRHRVHCRKGFFARSGAVTSLLVDTEAPRVPIEAAGGREAAVEEEGARRAVAELRSSAPEIAVEQSRPLRLPPPPKASEPGKEKKEPVFKSETRLVEVPVLVETRGERGPAPLSEKDFRVYEDDVLREIAFFSRDAQGRSIAEVRERAIRNADASAPISPAGDMRELRLARCYLVLDDLTAEAGAFLRAKQAAERIIRERHTPLRPFSLHFTSEAEAAISAEEDAERMIERVRRSMPRASRDLTTNDGIMNMYEAYLIERGDPQAQMLAELRYASTISARHRNGLGEVDGPIDVSPQTIESYVVNASRQLLAENFSQVARALTGLRAVVHAARADPAADGKTIVYISGGFCMGRGSMRADRTLQLDDVIAAARKGNVRFVTIDAAGLTVDEPLGVGASGRFLVRNPHLSSILAEHARGWRMDRQAPLHQLAVESGGRFVHATNDLAGAAMQSSGQLYYLGFLSKQPSDGRFHRIRVSVSVPGALLQARKGYFAVGQAGSPKPAAAGSEGVDWETVLKAANEARRSGDMKRLAGALEQLVQRYPNQLDFWYSLGAAHLRLGNAQRSVEALQRAFALAPEDRNVGLTLARALAAAGYRAAAGETLEHLARRSPRDVDLLISLGRVYESDSRTDDAHSVYRRVLDLGLKPPLELYLLLTRTSMRLGRRVEATLFIEDYLARGGDAAKAAEWRPIAPGNPQ